MLTTNGDDACGSCSCPVGRYSDDLATECTACADGYSALEGEGKGSSSAEACEACPPGYYVKHDEVQTDDSVTGLACSACPGGKYTEDVSASTACILCPTNTFSAEIANYPSKNCAGDAASCAACRRLSGSVHLSRRLYKLWNA